MSNNSSPSTSADPSHSSAPNKKSIPIIDDDPSAMTEGQEIIIEVLNKDNSPFQPLPPVSQLPPIDTTVKHQTTSSSFSIFSSYIHKFVVDTVNKFLDSDLAKKIYEYTPFMSHINFKILLFLGLVIYSYLKMRRVSPANAQKIRMFENVCYQNCVHLTFFYIKFFQSLPFSY